MADPVTLATIGMGASAAGAGVSAFGQLFSGQSQANMYNYQAAIAKQNATVAQQDANYATESGEVEATQSGLQTKAQIGKTVAGFGAGNVDPGSGSAKQVISSEVAIGQENQGVIRANAAKRAYGFNVQAAGDVASAGALGDAASTAKTASYLGAGGSILGGIGSVSSKWTQAGQSFGSGGSDSGVNPDSLLGRGVYSNSIYS